MTKERICANDKTQPIEPVSTWENRDSKHCALLPEHMFREHVEKTQVLRDRQAAYLAALPTDPPEAIRAARKLMHPNGGDEYPEGIKEALHLSYALEALVKDENIGDEGQARDAALYVADRVAFAIHRATNQLDRISDILDNPGRIERDRHN